MTKAQRKIVSSWFLMIALLIIYSIFDDWILDHWETLRWPALGVILVIAALSRKKPVPGEGRHQFNRIVEESPWVKLYLAVYGITLAIGVNYVIFNNVDRYEEAGVFKLLGAIVLLILPVIIIQQKEAYIMAGKEI